MGVEGFIPRGNCCNRSLTIVATDNSPAGPQKDTLFVTVPNRPPTLRQTGEVFKVRPGQTVRLRLKAWDPDGDDIVQITQIAGPGMISGNEWSWRVPEPYWGPPWRLVGFELEDSCGGTSLAYLLVWIPQPPRASNTHAWVRRGETSTASLYVYDPDTPPDKLTLAFQEPSGVSVQVVAIEKPPYYYGSYYGYTARVEVSVHKDLCPGDYEVPFTVTDPDGNESSATLTVHVRGNRPPQCSPSHLYGEATVPLPSRGIVSPVPVVMRIHQMWDPDGDQVSADVPGEKAPSYAANLSAFLAPSDDVFL